MEWRHGEYLLGDDPTRLDLEVICDLLKSSYWASHRSREQIAKSVQHSICFGLFHPNRQVGFARIVTDYSTISWLCDVIIHPDHRGRGLGKWMLECILDYPATRPTRFILATRDAQRFYEPFGFRKPDYDCLLKVNKPPQTQQAEAG